MQIVPLEAVPNQSVTARLGGERFEIRLRDIGGMMAADVSRGDVPIVRGQRVVAGAPLLPYRHLEAGVGNLIFVNAEDVADAIPYWPDFGTRTRLVYATEAGIRGA